jgi:hypothetical protein
MRDNELPRKSKKKPKRSSKKKKTKKRGGRSLHIFFFLTWSFFLLSTPRRTHSFFSLFVRWKKERKKERTRKVFGIFSSAVYWRN